MQQIIRKTQSILLGMPTVSDVLNQTPGLRDDVHAIGVAEPMKLYDQDSDLAVKITSRADTWYYASEIKNDLQGVDLPAEFIEEALTCAWEYSRCIISHFTNWDRYIAFTRTVIIGIIGEFRGDLVDVAAGNNPLGFDLEELLDTLFGGRPDREEMARYSHITN